MDPYLVLTTEGSSRTRPRPWLQAGLTPAPAGLSGLNQERVSVYNIKKQCIAWCKTPYCMLRKCGPFINIITSNYCIIILLGHWIFANCIVWSLKSIFREFYFKLSDFRLVSKSFGDPPCTLIIKQIKQIVNKMVLTDVGKYCCEVGHFSWASDALKCRHWSFRNLFYKKRNFP